MISFGANSDNAVPRVHFSTFDNLAGPRGEVGSRTLPVAVAPDFEQAAWYLRFFTVTRYALYGWLLLPCSSG